MHRHGYKGRKFGRETDQRSALIAGLMRALIEHGSVKTTLAKAKEIRRPTEKLVTLAKRGGLVNRRLVIARLNSIEIGGYLVDIVAPQVKRTSGYLRIEREGFRKGDNAEMARISFVDEIKKEIAKADKGEKKAAPVKEESKKTEKEGK